MSQYHCRTSAECQAEAKKKGQVIVLPGPNELQLDIDSEEALTEFEGRLLRMGDTIARAGIDYTTVPSPSGRPGRYHVTVRLPFEVKDEGQRIFLQTLLGSDPMREALNYRRFLDGDENPSLFFELPTPGELEESGSRRQYVLPGLDRDFSGDPPMGACG